MHFDDRLSTVLRHRAAGDRAARTQFRQLLDLLGSKPRPREGERDESLLAAAWLRLGALGEAIPKADRVAMIQDPALRFRSAELAAHLAEDEPDVAAAALARADLSEDDWAALIPRLPVRARGFLRLRRNLPRGTVDLLDRLGIQDRGLPEPDQSEPRPNVNGSGQTTTPDTPPAPEKTEKRLPEPANDGLDPEPAAGDEDTAIGALVKRIEAFQKARSDPRESPDAPRLPLGESADAAPAELTGFAFTTDAQGRINWSDRAVAPMVVGTMLDRSVVGTSLRFRQPISTARIALQGGPLIAGEWIIDAQPRFTRPDGRFYGYAGMLRRNPRAVEDEARQNGNEEADRLRQLLHELRTPVNAIQGFSEVIQQQLFGPTPHEYRALAAGIAGDSARMLAGFDELDRLAKLETGTLDIDPGQCDFAAIVEQQVGQLQNVLAPRTASFTLGVDGDAKVALAQSDAEAVAWRILASLAGATGAGEQITIELAPHGGALRLCSELPASLAAEADLFAASAKPSASVISAGMFGAGFTLRLARAEARAAGGDLTRVDDWLLLTLPLLTGAEAEPSQSKSGSAA
ncbi:sensor histidine kinase [Pontixanthobacter aquaemixtae]|uniref:histidine kinase n=1 Tax=Pontixanthobacter aquaemixtae TaxID=1958940 RepID=A0A844ZN25_9SPHN|nr:HAMP domain-containing histidine kinase [Pontixanthobacter aquaemixtae]MXO89781.1 sensor histidine kinase [Pontixanthobacter aquaemixtae]